MRKTFSKQRQLDGIEIKNIQHNPDCRDEIIPSCVQYIALGISGRNLHVLGKILIAKEDASSAAAQSLQRPIAA